MDMPANAKMQTISGKKYVFIDAPYWNGADLLIQTNKYHKKSNRTLILIMQPLELR